MHFNRIQDAVNKYIALYKHYSKDNWIKYEVAVDRLSYKEYVQFCNIIEAWKGDNKID